MVWLQALTIKLSQQDHLWNDQQTGSSLNTDQHGEVTFKRLENNGKQFCIVDD